jgi:hypothetical protein
MNIDITPVAPLPLFHISYIVLQSLIGNFEYVSLKTLCNSYRMSNLLADKNVRPHRHKNVHKFSHLIISVMKLKMPANVILCNSMHYIFG